MPARRKNATDPASKPADADAAFIQQQQAEDARERAARQRVLERRQAIHQFKVLRNQLLWYGEGSQEAGASLAGLVQRIQEVLQVANQLGVHFDWSADDPNIDRSKRWALRIYRHIAAGQIDKGTRLTEAAEKCDVWPWVLDYLKRLLLEEALAPDPPKPASTAGSAGAPQEPVPTSPAPNESVMWLTVSEAASLSAISAGLITRAVNDGEIISNGKRRKERRINAADFNRWHLARLHKQLRQDGARLEKHRPPGTGPGAQLRPR